MSNLILIFAKENWKPMSRLFMLCGSKPEKNLFFFCVSCYPIKCLTLSPRHGGGRHDKFKKNVKNVLLIFNKCNLNARKICKIYPTIKEPIPFNSIFYSRDSNFKPMKGNIVISLNHLSCILMFINF